MGLFLSECRLDVFESWKRERFCCKRSLWIEAMGCTVSKRLIIRCDDFDRGVCRQKLNFETVFDIKGCSHFEKDIFKNLCANFESVIVFGKNPRTVFTDHFRVLWCIKLNIKKSSYYHHKITKYYKILYQKN